MTEQPFQANGTLLWRLGGFLAETRWVYIVCLFFRLPLAERETKRTGAFWGCNSGKEEKKKRSDLSRIGSFRCHDAQTAKIESLGGVS